MQWREPSSINRTMAIENDQIKLFRSLFHGRDDAFAIRWEKGNKSGYMPSYQFDPYHYRIHKAKGGTLSNYQDKTFQPLTDEQIKRHLLGEQLIGIYPLLLNNTSHFIAADFDGDNWLEQRRENSFKPVKLLVFRFISNDQDLAMVGMCGCSSQNLILHSRVARYFCPYFKPQEYSLYLIKTQVLIVSFQIKIHFQEKVWET